jgi:hypothetical protein
MVLRTVDTVRRRRGERGEKEEEEEEIKKETIIQGKGQSSTTVHYSPTLIGSVLVGRLLQRNPSGAYVKFLFCFLCSLFYSTVLIDSLIHSFKSICSIHSIQIR